MDVMDRSDDAFRKAPGAVFEAPQEWSSPLCAAPVRDCCITLQVRL